MQGGCESLRGIIFQNHFAKAKSLRDIGLSNIFRAGSNIIGTLAVCCCACHVADLISLKSE